MESSTMPQVPVPAHHPPVPHQSPSRPSFQQQHEQEQGQQQQQQQQQPPQVTYSHENFPIERLMPLVASLPSPAAAGAAGATGTGAASPISPTSLFSNAFSQPEKEPAPPRGSRGWRFYGAFGCLCMLSFITALDATIISVAIPTIAEDIGATATEAFWMGSSFLLGSTVFQPAFASFSHIFGRQPVVLSALLIFTVGSIMCAVAKEVALLLAGRTMQGIGAGGMLALTYVIATDLVSLRERGKWFSLISATWAIGSVVGPVVGGALAERSWPWIFWINLPFCAITLVMIPAVLTLRRKEGTFDKKLGTFDWIGAVLFVAALTAVLIPLSWGGVSYAWSDTHTVVPLVVGLAGLVGFGFHIVKLAPRLGVDPLIRPSLFGTLTGLTAYLNTVLLGCVVWAVMFYLPLYSEVPLGQSATSAGISLFPYSATVAPAAAVVGVLITRTGRYRPTVWVGWALATLGLGLLMLLDEHTRTVQWVFIFLVGGLGLGGLYSALSFACQASAEGDDLPFAAGMYAFCRSLGQCIGVTIGGAVFQNAFKSSVQRDAVFGKYADEWAKNASALAEMVRRLPASQAAMKEAIIHGYVEALRSVWLLTTIIAAVGLVTGTLFIKHKSLDRAFQTNLIDKHSRAADAAARAGRDVEASGSGSGSYSPRPLQATATTANSVEYGTEKAAYYGKDGSGSPASLQPPGAAESIGIEEAGLAAGTSRVAGGVVVSPPEYYYSYGEDRQQQQHQQQHQQRVQRGGNEDGTYGVVVSESPPALGPLDFEFDLPESPEPTPRPKARWSFSSHPGRANRRSAKFSGAAATAPLKRDNASAGAPVGPAGVWRPSDGSAAIVTPPPLDRDVRQSRLWRGQVQYLQQQEKLRQQQLWEQQQWEDQQQQQRKQQPVSGRYVDAWGKEWDLPVGVVTVHEAV